MPGEPFRLTVYGVPEPQGSKRLGRHGTRFVVLESNDAKLRPWRAAVTAEARAVAGRSEPFEGPLRLAIRFSLPRPKSIPKKRVYPEKKPDLSKLIRAIEDALTDAGIYGDDAQICVIDAEKRYVGDPLALDGPGVRVRLEVLE